MSKEVIFDTLGDFSRPYMLKAGYRSTSCIGATRITIDVLSHYGIRSKPIPCWVSIWNKEFVALVQEVGIEKAAEIVHAIDVDVKGGPWNAGVGVNPTNRLDVVGHLAVVTELIDGTPWLLDISLDQASRPHKNMSVKPIAVEGFEEDGDFFANRDELFAGIVGPDGIEMVWHRVQKGNGLWRTSTNWVPSYPVNADVVSATIKKIDQILGGSNEQHSCT